MATLQGLRSKIKAIPSGTREKLYLALIMLLVALFAFGLGRLSVYYGGQGEIQVIQ